MKEPDQEERPKKNTGTTWSGERKEADQERVDYQEQEQKKNIVTTWYEERKEAHGKGMK